MQQLRARQVGVCTGLLGSKKLSWIATTKGIDAGLDGELMMKAVEKCFGKNGKPPQSIEWLTNNGSYYYRAPETRSFVKQLGFKPLTTPLTSPQSISKFESFVNTKSGTMQRWLRPDSKSEMDKMKDWYNENHWYQT
jgi:putative transposase